MTKTENPKYNAKNNSMDHGISVVIPTFKRENLLKRGVHQIIPQLKEKDEIIICNDDRGTDLNEKIAKLTNNNKIITINNYAERGPASTRNIGADHAKNKVILFLDDDDIVHDGYLESIRRTLDLNPNSDYGYSNIDITYESAPENITKIEPEIALKVTKSKDKLFGACCGFWIKRDVFEKVGKFDPSLWNSEDNDICARLHASKFTCVKFKKRWILVCRSHEKETKNITGTTENAEKLRCWWQVYSKNSKSLAPIDGVRLILLERFVRRSVKLNSTAYAIKKMLSKPSDPLITIGLIYLIIKYTGNKIKNLK